MNAIRVGSGAFLIILAACSSSSGSSSGPSDSGTHTDAPATSTNDWSCLGHVTLALPAKPTLAWQVEPIDIVSAKPFPGLAVQACPAGDGPCANPVATATTDATTGIATLSVPSGQEGFTGFWQAQPTGDVPNLLFSNIPIRNDVQVDGRQQWSAGEVLVALGSGGVQWDSTKGIVGFQIHDCNSSFLHQDTTPSPGGPRVVGQGVSVSISSTAPGIVAGYFLGDTLSTTATQTDASGQGGFVNVPEGWVTFTAKLAATGQTIGTASVYSKAGALTGTVLAPSP